MIWNKINDLIWIFANGIDSKIWDKTYPLINIYIDLLIDKIKDVTLSANVVFKNRTDLYHDRKQTDLIDTIDLIGRNLGANYSISAPILDQL